MSATLDLVLRRIDDPDAVLDDPRQAVALLGPLAGLSAAGLLAWALAQAALLSGLPVTPGAPLLAVATPFELTLAYFSAGAAGLFGAQLAGLPTFYFYTLLAGIPTHAWRVSAESLRAQATAGLVLLSVVPVHLALGLGLRLLDEDGGAASTLAALGTALPFLTGLFAPLTLLRAMKRLGLRAAPGGRKPLPTLLVLGWSAVFTAMAPLGLARVLEALLGIGA